MCVHCADLNGKSIHTSHGVSNPLSRSTTWTAPALEQPDYKQFGEIPHVLHQQFIIPDL